MIYIFWFSVTSLCIQNSNALEFEGSLRRQNAFHSHWDSSFLVCIKFPLSLTLLYPTALLSILTSLKERGEKIFSGNISGLVSLSTFEVDWRSVKEDLV